MKLGQLEKLENLTGKRVDQTRQLLDAEVAKLNQLDSHCEELTFVNKEYQQSLVGGSEVAPQHLQQRRAFVDKLTLKIQQIVSAREEKAQLVQTISEEHVHRTAQHAAIEIVKKQRKHESELRGARYEQSRMDDAARQLYFEKMTSHTELDNDR